MSEYQTLRFGPGAPPDEIAENLLPWQSPVDNEPNWTGVRTDDAIRERLMQHRETSRHEMEEIGSEYRSDRIPLNFRVAQFFIPEGVGARDFDFHVSFPVWAIRFQVHGVFIAGSFSPPNGSLLINPYGISVQSDMTVNLPHSLSSIAGQYANPAGVIDGTGYHIWAYDRWVPR